MTTTLASTSPASRDLRAALIQLLEATNSARSVKAMDARSNAWRAYRESLTSNERASVLAFAQAHQAQHFPDMPLVQSYEQAVTEFGTSIIAQALGKLS